MRLERYDITNPALPILKYLLNNDLRGISRVDIKTNKNYAYLTSGNYLLMIDISNPDTGKVVYLANANIDPNTPGAGTFNSVTAYNSTVLTGYLGMTVFKNNLVTGVTTSTPAQINFKLFQNYPNPFNPSTTIGYDVPKLSHIKLVVYDILGRKIKMLVDSEKFPGHYQVTFDAGKLASGVYFYSLQAGTLVETRKMILIR